MQRVCAVVLICVLAACGGNQHVPPQLPQPGNISESVPMSARNVHPTPCPAADYTCIQHVVIIIQ
jgi:hypothetical protein